ncbi:hypothetical protein NX801_25670 [Streptomyces sp. LP05-1]|uniref:Secreted protein n=1 Tax=Streptomyces pyxinae TaxID=2970734 RepID=A0ABT2CNG3_9ACTN|nr:hypothetical protein [Streptomyces sp. LP05-1]MCS0638975.1 hypothetical protein [Streptomyces sp. LP05-1]
MNPTKVAAAVAGSVLALGVAAPAFAADSLTPSSLNGAVDTLGKRGLTETVPADTGIVRKVKSTADGLKGKDAPLLGGLPLGK